MQCPQVARTSVLWAVPIILFWFGHLASPASATDRAKAEQTVAQAIQVYQTMGSRIPASVRRRAVAIGVFPSVKKAGFLIGGSIGTGLVVARRGGTWSGPAFYRMAAVSYGLQAGVQSADIVLVIMSRRGLQKFLSPKFTLGNDTTVAVGDKGTKKSFFKVGEVDVVTYSRVKGAFAGLSVQGANISYLSSRTGGYYGQRTTSRQVLVSRRGLAIPASGRRLAGVLGGGGGTKFILVRDIQSQLRLKGYLADKPDGQFGPKTRAAIRVYQSAKGLPVTGAPSSALLKHLRSR